MGQCKRILVMMGSIAASVLSACGGGSGDTPAPPPPPNPLYVRVLGSDTNTGGSPDQALQTISRAAQIARSGYTIIVGPGTYRESVTTDRPGQQVPQGISFFADTRGVATGDRANPVVIDPGGVNAAFNISNTGPVVVGGRVVNPTIDGFTVVGAGDAGIVIKGGSSFAVQSCTVVGATGDSIRIQSTLNALVFNNLLYDNGGNGIAVVRGASGARLLNNTLTLNVSRGITVGNADQPAPLSTMRNNIIQANGGDASIKIFPPGDVGYTGGFNLVLPDVYSPTSIRRVQDIHVDAQFVDPALDDFYLQPTSPAINRGAALNDVTTVDTSLVIDGTPCIVSNAVQCVVPLTDYLNDRTATGGNNCDRSALDMGFHTLPVDRCTGAQ